jgi:carbamate kinase
VACTQGEIGYILQQSLQREIDDMGLPQSVMAILTQMVVKRDDPAFGNPTKPIGPFYSEEAAEEKKRLSRWDMVEDSSRGYRRVVASPQPVEVVEEEAIRGAFRQGVLVIAAGGGGIPVIREGGGLRGVDAVIDKDRASLLIASKLSVETLIFSTDAEYVYLDFKKPGQKALREIRVRDLRPYFEAGHFPAGSMGPKVEAALHFLEAGGKEVIITSLENLVAAVRGEAGTRILP